MRPTSTGPADDHSVLHPDPAAHELPLRDRSPGASALVLVDLQEAFFEDPALDQVRHDLVRRCNSLLRAAGDADVPVVNVRTEHRRDRSTWTLNMLEDDQGFAFTGTAQADPVAGLEVAGVHEVVKTRDSSFHGTGLATLLAGLGVRTVVLVGVSTHSCVRMTAADAYAHDLHAVLVTDAVASEQPDDAQAAVEELVREYRLDALTTDELLAQWSSGA